MEVIGRLHGPAPLPPGEELLVPAEYEGGWAVWILLRKRDMSYSNQELKHKCVFQPADLSLCLLSYPGSHSLNTYVQNSYHRTTLHLFIPFLFSLQGNFEQIMLSPLHTMK